MKEKIEILHVEDAQSYSRLIKSMINDDAQDFEINISHVGNLKECFDFLAENNIDVILLDLQLPDSEGIDTFLRIHGIVHEIPIVILTALESKNIALELVKEGAQDYLFKSDVKSGILIRSLLFAVKRKRSEEQLRKGYENLETLLKEYNIKELNRKDEEQNNVGRDELIIRYREKKYQKAFYDISESIDFIILEVDDNGSISYANKTAERALEMAYDKIIGSKFVSLFDKLSRIEAIKIYQNVFNRKSIERILKLKNGKIFKVSGIPEINERNEPCGLICIGRDLTKQGSTHQEREKLKKRLEEMKSKMKSLSSLLPACSNCFKVKDEKGEWHHIEKYLENFHGNTSPNAVCPECAQRLSTHALSSETII